MAKVSSHQEALNIAKELHEELGRVQDDIKEQGRLQSWLNGNMTTSRDIAKTINAEGEVKIGITRDILKKTQETVEANKEVGAAILSSVGGLNLFQSVQKAINLLAAANPWLALAAVVVGIVTAVIALNTKLTETGKEFGVSRKEAAEFEILLGKARFNAALIPISAEEARDAFKAINENLGGVAKASEALVREISLAAAQTGLTADEFTSVLSLQESISSLSREQLIAQTKMTAEAIRLKGVLPQAIFKDIAENAEFFAKYAGDGGKSLTAAAVQARKLGLSMSTVAGVTESLMDFEGSIEKQLEASMLLGRELNLDKARQLAFLGKQDQMMQEILKQVGGEAEFTRMLPIQRQKLADAVGVNVQELSRLVRDRGAAGMAAAGDAVGAAMGDVQDQQLTVLYDIRDKTEEGNRHHKKTADNTGGLQ